MNKAISYLNSQLDLSKEAKLNHQIDKSEGKSFNFTGRYLVALPETERVAETERSNPKQNLKPTRKIAPGLVRRFVPYQSPRAIDVSHQWECVVAGISECGETIDVDLYDLLDSEREVEYGSFDIREIPPSERPKIEVGVVLYWAIGYENHKGTHRRVSEIRLKRMPRITRMMAMETKKRSTELANEFGVSPE